MYAVLTEVKVDEATTEDARKYLTDTVAAELANGTEGRLPARTGRRPRRLAARRQHRSRTPNPFSCGYAETGEVSRRAQGGAEALTPSLQLSLPPSRRVRR